MPTIRGHAELPVGVQFAPQFEVLHLTTSTWARLYDAMRLAKRTTVVDGQPVRPERLPLRRSHSAC